MDEATPIEPGGEPQLEFPVVGVGASAGGLEAVTTMFQNIESGTGMAYVLVMHLDPDHESMMAELLSSKTGINVRQIADNDHVEVDCLHVIPPGSSLRLEGGKFRLEQFSEPRGLRRPIDSFFISLAQAQGDKSACVVLSGTGADGTAGMRIVKEFGGICVVQTPEEARYDGMPFSALSTKLVDFALPADDIVPRIKAFFDGAFEPRFPEDDLEAQRMLLDICMILKRSVGIDFSGYKRSTLFRRLNRRLQVLEFKDIDKYASHLAEDEREQHALTQDFLINVTSFFRDHESFEMLRKSVIVPLVRECSSRDEIRLWVPGCSSGQEAYSLAMLIEATCEQFQVRPLVQIFATDVDEVMIDQARRAVYPLSTYSELPSKYRDAYTIALDEKFEIVSRIREMVRFSVHNILQDPPFSKIDLISCRNLLIYLGEDLQNDIFPLMHFSLRPEGHLFLGTSENVTRRRDLFAALDERARIFQRQETGRRTHINLPLGSGPRTTGVLRGSSKMARERDFPPHRSFGATNAAIYEAYAPPFIRVAADGRIVDSSGDVSLFLMSKPGEERSLDALAREGVRDIAMPMIDEALKLGQRRANKDVEVSSPFGLQKADLIAHPLKDSTVALIFLVKERLKPVVDEYEVSPVTRDRQVADLQDDLKGARLLLKSKVEEIETANEELKSSNEEMMSMNEELQSANEELTTANEELKNKIDELTLANADLDNFMQSSDLAMLVLDRAMRIRHVTDAARDVLPLLRSDTGRSLSEFNISFGKIDIGKEIHAVIESGESFSATTLPNDEGKTFFLRITPFFFADGSVEGATITLLDITNETQLRQNLTAESEKLKLVMEAAQVGFWDTDLETGKSTIDPIASKLAGLSDTGEIARDAISTHVLPEDEEKHIKLRNAALAKGEGYMHTVRMAVPGEDMRWVRVHAQPYVGADGKKRVSGLGIDVTETMKLQQDLAEESHKLRLALSTGRMGVAEMDVDSRETTADATLAEQLDLGAAGVFSPEGLTAHIFDEDVSLINDNLSKAIDDAEEYEFDFRVNPEEGDMRWIRSRGFLYVGEDGRKKVVAPTVDITASKLQDMLLDEMSHRIKNLFAVVSGLVQAVPKTHPETEQMAKDLLERLVSLGKVYDLARKEPSSPQVDLGELFNSVLRPHVSTQKLTIKGPPTQLRQDMLNTFTLIVHELATNAAKYGCLSLPDGKLDISWTLDDAGVASIRWNETAKGLKAAEEHEGFGTLLIQSSVRQSQGKFERKIGKTGAKIKLSLGLAPAKEPQDG